jgi:Ca2+:H+ antiporter
VFYAEDFLRDAAADKALEGNRACAGCRRERHNMVRLLLVAFLPLAAGLHYFAHIGSIWVFVTGAIAVAVLADWVRRATEQVAAHAGPAIGGLTTVSFGSIAELLLAFFVLTENGASVVRAQITGSIIGTSLLGLGLAMLAGGVKFDRQKFNRQRAGLLASMLILVVIALLLPAVFHAATGAPRESPHAPPITDEELSLAVSVVLLRLYAGNLIYTLVTHRDVFSARQAQNESEAKWSLGSSLAVLSAATVAVAIGAEIVSAAAQATAQNLGVSLLFMGVVPLALIGTFADLLAAVIFGRQNRMELAISICVGSAIQAALVIAPLLVLASWAIGRPMTLVFSNPLDLFAIAGTVFIVNAIAGDGETTWFEGSLLVGVYVLFAFAFFFTGSV